MDKPKMIYDVVIDYNSMEMTQHGTYDFPVAVYNTILRNNLLGYVDWHWHKELQFCYVTCGSVEFHVGRDKYTLDENCGIFINSGHLHMARPAAGSDDAFVCLDFDPKLLTIFSGSVFENRYVKPFIESSSFSHQILEPKVIWQKEILDLLDVISGLYKETPPYFEYDILHQPFSVWCSLLKNADVDRAGGTYKKSK